MGIISFKIGRLRLQPNRQLIDGDQHVPLGSKALALLSVLAEAQGELVTKDELMAAVWPGVIVEENAIQVHISALRKVMGDAADHLITIRGLGYRVDVEQFAAVGATQPFSPLTPNAMLEQAPLSPNKIPIAVLPFNDMTAAQDKAELIAELCEEIASAIARHNSYQVVRTRAVLRSRDLAAIARETGVTYVLDGSVQAHGKQLRISTRIVAPLTEGQLKADRFSGHIDDGFELIDRVASMVSAQLESSVMRAEVERIAAKPAQSRTAYDCFLLARISAMRVDRVSLETAQMLCERAIELDTHLAVAHALLGWCHALLYQSGWSVDPIETRRRGLEHSRIAISSDESNHDVLRTFSTAMCCLGADLTAANAILARARERSPDEHTLMSASAWTMVLSGGKQQEAIDLFEMALQLDSQSPLAVFIILGQAIGHFTLRRFEEAVRLTREVVARRPGYGLAHATLAAALAHSDRIEEARLALADAPPETPFTILLDVIRAPDDRALFQAGLSLAGVEFDACTTALETNPA